MKARALLLALRVAGMLPLALLAPLGRLLGALLFALARERRHVALRNLELCMPSLDERARVALAREHFGWLGRSLLERGLLWFGSRERLERLIHVEGDVGYAGSTDAPVMWLVPHLVALDVAAVALQLFQSRHGCSVYQAQSDPVFDAAMRRGRLRFGKVEIFARSERALPLVRAIRRGAAFFNLPDMDFGARDAAFVPFFGVEAATLLAPSKMARSLNMTVQPVVAEILPGGHGYRVRFLPPWQQWPTDDAVADAAAMNRWIESEIASNPAQYLWVHKRFKTRPAGQASVY